MPAQITSKLEDEIAALEAERARCDDRIQEITAALKGKYREWHAEQFAKRVEAKRNRK